MDAFFGSWGFNPSQPPHFHHIGWIPPSLRLVADGHFSFELFPQTSTKSGRRNSWMVLCQRETDLQSDLRSQGVPSVEQAGETLGPGPRRGNSSALHQTETAKGDLKNGLQHPKMRHGGLPWRPDFATALPVLDFRDILYL